MRAVTGHVLGIARWEGETSVLIPLLPLVPELGREEQCSWHIRGSPATAMYIFDSNHTFLLLQKGSGVQNSYTTQISLFRANTLVCRRMGKSSNKLKGSAIELSLAGALQPDLNQTTLAKSTGGLSGQSNSA